MEAPISPSPGLSGLQKNPVQGVIVVGTIYSGNVQGGGGRSIFPRACVRDVIDLIRTSCIQLLGWKGHLIFRRRYPCPELDLPPIPSLQGQKGSVSGDVCMVYPSFPPQNGESNTIIHKNFSKSVLFDSTIYIA